MNAASEPDYRRRKLPFLFMKLSRYHVTCLISGWFFRFAHHQQSLTAATTQFDCVDKAFTPGGVTQMASDHILARGKIANQRPSGGASRLAEQISVSIECLRQPGVDSCGDIFHFRSAPDTSRRQQRMRGEVDTARGECDECR